MEPTPVPDATPPLLEQLLDAHVAHELAALEGPGFADVVRREVEHALDVAGGVPLEQVVTREAVAGVADKYVASFRLPGAIPGVAGEIARRVRRVVPRDATLGDLLDRATVVEVVSVVAEMRAARVQLLRGVATSPVVQAGVGDAVHTALGRTARGAATTGRRAVERVPGAAAGLRLTGQVTSAVARRVAPGLPEELDQRGREAAERAAQVLLSLLGAAGAEALDDEEVLDIALGLWDDLAAQPLGSIVGAVSEEHLDAVVAALYGAWLDLRTSPLLRSLVAEGVAWFFDAYGAMPLRDLLAEFGLDVDDLVEEAVRFGPPALEGLRATGVLEALLRRRLEPFYRSAAAARLVTGASGPSGSTGSAGTDQ